MNGKDIFLGLSYIDRKFVDEAEIQTFSQSRHKTLRSPILIAAIIALMLFLMGCAVVMMRLQNLTIREETSSIPTETDFYGEEINRISIQGFMGTDSYAAFKEWQEFLNVYDPDNSILYANNDFQTPEAYYSYSCYSQEMIDKIDEICEKYGLEPLGTPWFFDRAEDVFEAVGIESALAENVQMGPHDGSGYCYKDGTFAFEGEIELSGDWNELVSFDYRSVRKTSFDGVFRSIGNVEEYDQWNYTMQDGTNVLLALREDGGLIIVDKEDSFVTVGVLGVFANGSPFADVPNERAFLEDFCKCFDFTYQTQLVDAAKADALYQAQLEREAQEDQIQSTAGRIDSAYLSSYAGFIEYMVTEMKYKDLKYALIDVDDNGVEELLLQCEHKDRYNGDPNSFFDILTIKDGEVWRIMSGSNMNLCQGGVIEYPYTNSHYYYNLSTALEAVKYRDGIWYKQEICDVSDEVEITEEEAKAIIAKYPRMDIEFKPVEEFPVE